MSRRAQSYPANAAGHAQPEIAASLPHNLEAERSILGAILVAPLAFDVVANTISENDFMRDAHRRVYAAMRALRDKGVVVDLVTLKEELSRSGQLDESGGPAYIASLADGMPRSTNIQYYAEIVADLALRRHIIFAANEILTDAYAGEDGDGRAVLRRADDLILNLGARRHASELVSQETAILELSQQLERRISTHGALTGVDTGLSTLNEMTGGWQRGDLILIAARTSIGKTALALNMAVTAARAQVPVAVFSLEMSREQVEMRLLSYLSSVMMFRIMRGWLGQGDYQRISDALNVLHGLQIHVDDTSRLMVSEIRSKARRMQATVGLGLVVVDYVQLVTGSGHRKNANRTEELGEISRRLKMLAKELNTPIIALSQLKRAPETKSEYRPQLSDLRESGALEQDADAVLIIHRKDHKVSGDCELILEKQRNGPTGPFPVTFTRETVSFTDKADDSAPSEEESSARHLAPRRIEDGLPYVEAGG